MTLPQALHGSPIYGARSTPGLMQYWDCWRLWVAGIWTVVILGVDVSDTRSENRHNQSCHGPLKSAAAERPNR